MIIFLVILLILSWVLFLLINMRRDGHIVANDAAESITIVLTVDPRTINKRRRIVLTVDK